jgi:drug/metabolite transporter (DMT)-like permease
VAAAAVLWAVGGAVASRLIHRGADFIQLTEARAWISMLLLFAAARVRRPEEPDDGPLDSRSLGAPRVRRPGPALTLLFGASIAGANFLYYASLSRLPVAVAITVQYTGPGLVVLWASIVERRRPSGRVLAALAAAMLGVALLAELPSVLVSGELRVDGLGLLAACCSAVSYATYMITAEHMGRAVGARTAVLRGFVVASVLWILVQASRGRPDTLLDRRFVGGAIFLAIATTVLPFLLFVWAVSHVRATDAGIV